MLICDKSSETEYFGMLSTVNLAFLPNLPVPERSNLLLAARQQTI